MLSCDSNTSTPNEPQLILSQFNGDESQLWRFDGGHIESVKFIDQVISLVPASQKELCLTTKGATDKAQLFKLEVSVYIYLVILIGNQMLIRSKHFASFYSPPPP